MTPRTIPGESEHRLGEVADRRPESFAIGDPALCKSARGFGIRSRDMKLPSWLASDTKHAKVPAILNGVGTHNAPAI